MLLLYPCSLSKIFIYKNKKKKKKHPQLQVGAVIHNRGVRRHNGLGVVHNHVGDLAPSPFPRDYWVKRERATCMHTREFMLRLETSVIYKTESIEYNMSLPDHVCITNVSPKQLPCQLF